MISDGKLCKAMLYTAHFRTFFLQLDIYPCVARGHKFLSLSMLTHGACGIDERSKKCINLFT